MKKWLLLTLILITACSGGGEVATTTSPDAKYCGELYAEESPAYLSEDAAYGWGVGHCLDYLVTCYEAFGGASYLAEARVLIDDAIAKQDGVGWSTERYTPGYLWKPGTWTANIGIGIARYCQYVNAPELIALLEDLIELHEEEWTGEYYIFSEDGPKNPGLNLPHNQQNLMGILLIYTYELTGNEACLDRAKTLGVLFLSHLEDDGDGYKWKYHFDPAATILERYGYDSRGYATIEIEFICKLAPYMDVNIERFVNTFNNPDSRMHFYNIKAGALLSEYGDVTEGLEKVQPDIAGSDKPKLDRTEEWWFTVPYLYN